jgi:hypothetical protein
MGWFMMFIGFLFRFLFGGGLAAWLDWLQQLLGGATGVR